MCAASPRWARAWIGTPNLRTGRGQLPNPELPDAERDSRLETGGPVFALTRLPNNEEPVIGPMESDSAGIGGL